MWSGWKCEISTVLIFSGSMPPPNQCPVATSQAAFWRKAIGRDHLMFNMSRRDVMLAAGFAAALGLNSRLAIVGSAQAQPAPDTGKGFYKYKIGSVEVTALYDGIWKKPHDPTFIKNASIEDTKEARMVRQHDVGTIRRLIAAIEEPFRETLVLREIENLSYREIADVADVPVGTVMSRLARARAMLRSAWLAEQEPKE